MKFQSHILSFRSRNHLLLHRKRKIEAEAKSAKLQNQLMLTKLNENQVAMVKSNASIIDGKVPAHLKLHWRILKFLGRLGSGSFGDCYKGTKDGRLVAIKRMRSGLVDDQVFKAFCKEVVVLAVSVILVLALAVVLAVSHSVVLVCLRARVPSTTTYNITDGGPREHRSISRLLH